MSRELVRQLKSLRGGNVNPREEWVKNNRDLLLAQINNTLPRNKKRGFGAQKTLNILSLFFPNAFVYNVLRPVGVAVLILGLISGGWVATVDASYGSVPGDLLYSTKRAAEKTQIVLASVVGNKAGETRLHAEFAKRRAIETKKVVVSGDPLKISKVSQLVKDLKKEIKEVNNKLDETKAAPAGLSAQTVKDVHDDTEKINNVLKEVKENLLAASSTGANLTQEVSSAKEMVKDTSVKAVEVMAAKHTGGDKSMSAEEVRQVINNQMQSTVNEAVESRQETRDVKAVLDTVNTEVKELVIESQLPTSVATGTQELVNRFDAAAQKVTEAVENSERVSAELDSKVQSVQGFLSSGDLQQAANMVRDMNSSTREMGKITDNSLQAVQTVLPPVVSAVKETVPSSSTSVPNITIIVTTTAVFPQRQSVNIATRTPSVIIIVATTTQSTTTRK